MATRTRIEAATLSAGAAAVIALLCLRALVRTDDSWDTWAYHLPFAARLWDIVPRSSFEMDDHLELLFRAYPVGVEWLQGALWKLTGRLQATSFVSLASLLGFVELLWRRFGVSRAKSAFALLAIPMVQIHATTAYVDLPANVAAASAVLSTFRAWTADRSDPHDASLGIVCAALAASCKFQMAPLAALVALALGWLLLARKEARTSTGIAVFVFAALLGSYPYLRNAVVFGQPFFPMSASSLWSSQAGSLSDYQGPRYLASWPRPARWLLSVLGVGELDTWRGMFSVDATSGTPGGRTWLMGGYFGPWVAVQLAFLWRLNRSGSRAARGAALTALAVALLAAVSPESHQLRYYAYFILVLVGLNLTRATTLPEAAPFAGRLYTRLSVFSFVAVVLLTRGRFLDPSEGLRGIADHVAQRAPVSVLTHLRAGGRYCLVGEPVPAFALSAELLGRGAYSLKSSTYLYNCADRTPVYASPDQEKRP